jgi:hypothetical protein
MALLEAAYILHTWRDVRPDDRHMARLVPEDGAYQVTLVIEPVKQREEAHHGA